MTTEEVVLKFIGWGFASDLFAGSLNGIVLWWFAGDENGLSKKIKLTANIMFSSATMTVGYLLIGEFGSLRARQFAPGWLYVALAVGIYRSVSHWLLTIEFIRTALVKIKKGGKQNGEEHNR